MADFCRSCEEGNREAGEKLLCPALLIKEANTNERRRFREEYSFQRHSSSEPVKMPEQFTVQKYVQISTSSSIKFQEIQTKCWENYSSGKVIQAKWTEALLSLNAVHSQYPSVPKSTVWRTGIWETLPQFCFLWISCTPWSTTRWKVFFVGRTHNLRVFVAPFNGVFQEVPGLQTSMNFFYCLGIP